MSTVRIVLTFAGLTLREAARRKVLRSLAVLTLLLLGLSAWGFARLDAEFGGLTSGEARLAATGRLTRSGEWFTVTLSDDEESAVPALVADLVALGVGVHAVEPARISLEDRLLGILRTGTSEEQP